MLLLDVGNSRCKWALAQAGAWTHQGVAGNTEWVVLQHAFAALPPPHRILVSNVAGEAMAQRLGAICAAWKCQPEFVTADAECCGVRNGYERAESLGSDRWAALIAAWQRVRGACLVVNCGTATTVDALSAQGEFLGGLILPGVSLMQHSLATNTAQLLAEQGSLQDFPRNTADAIHSGMMQATLGAIRHQFGLLHSRYGDVRCLLGGGAAEIVQPHLDLPLERVDNLVLKGLQVIGESEA
ncbi:MAG: type III pantothenate kinase [Nitrosomonadales bacterium]|nr:type III pantothenate kinase [Nitrosomonadales bacterium]